MTNYDREYVAAWFLTRVAARPALYLPSRSGGFPFTDILDKAQTSLVFGLWEALYSLMAQNQYTLATMDLECAGLLLDGWNPGDPVEFL